MASDPFIYLNMESRIALACRGFFWKDRIKPWSTNWLTGNHNFWGYTIVHYKLKGLFCRGSELTEATLTFKLDYMRTLTSIQIATKKQVGNRKLEASGTNSFVDFQVRIFGVTWWTLYIACISIYTLTILDIQFNVIL